MTRDWIAVSAGLIAWFTALVASWMLAPPAHETGSRVAMYAIDAIALAVALAAGAAALARARQLWRTPADDGVTQRARFVAACGVALSALAVILVIGLVLPNVLLAPGAEP